MTKVAALPPFPTPTELDALPPLLIPTELASLLRTTTNSLAQDRYLGRGVPFIKHGRKILYARDQVRAYLEANACQRTDDRRCAAATAILQI